MPVGRFWVEGLRIDPAHHVGGLRLNQWVALIVGVVALVYLVVDWQRHRGDVAACLSMTRTPTTDSERRRPGRGPEAMITSTSTTRIWMRPELG